MQGVLEGLDQDVEEESKVNCEVAALVVKRLQDGRRWVLGGRDRRK
jgi:hypothetical protein